MKHKIKSFLLALSLTTFGFLAVPATVSAANCTADQINTSFFGGCVNKKGAGTQNPVFIALLTIFNFLAVGIGIIVTGGIIYGGILITTGSGDAAKTKQGTTIIINSVIGLLCFLFMFAIINFIVPGGLFR